MVMDKYFADASFRFSLYEAADDPYPTYRELRDHWPVYRSWRPVVDGVRPVWAVSRYSDIQSISRDPDTFSNVTPSTFGDPPDLLMSDPPLHDELRDTVHAYFSPRGVRDRLAAVIESATRTALAAIRDHDEVDLAWELTWAIPVAVSAHLLGYLPSDHTEPRTLPGSSARRRTTSMPRSRSADGTRRRTS
jgi:cytochrome P450